MIMMMMIVDDYDLGGWMMAVGSQITGRRTIP
jgi:hypothetical protein